MLEENRIHINGVQLRRGWTFAACVAPRRLIGVGHSTRFASYKSRFLRTKTAVPSIRRAKTAEGIITDAIAAAHKQLKQADDFERKMMSKTFEQRDLVIKDIRDASISFSLESVCYPEPIFNLTLEEYMQMKK